MRPAEIAVSIRTESGTLMLDAAMVCRWVAMADTTSTLAELVGARYVTTIHEQELGNRPYPGSVLIFVKTNGDHVSAFVTPPVIEVECVVDDEAPTERLPVATLQV